MSKVSTYNRFRDFKLISKANIPNFQSYFSEISFTQFEKDNLDLPYLMILDMEYKPTKV